MKDFQGYIEQVEDLSEGFGMVKVVPPEGWKARKRGYKDINVQLTNPIRQHVRGLAGIYSLSHLLAREAQYYKGDWPNQ